MASIQSTNDQASRRFPPTLIEGHLVHVCQWGCDDWQVWLNTEVADFDGLCIGSGSTRDEALAVAVKALEAVVDFLQQPPRGR
jgi:hypothetical protein